MPRGFQEQGWFCCCDQVLDWHQTLRSAWANSVMELFHSESGRWEYAVCSRRGPFCTWDKRLVRGRRGQTAPCCSVAVPVLMHFSNSCKTQRNLFLMPENKKSWDFFVCIQNTMSPNHLKATDTKAPSREMSWRVTRFPLSDERYF